MCMCVCMCVCVCVCVCVSVHQTGDWSCHSMLRWVGEAGDE